MFATTVGPYRITCEPRRLPELYETYRPHARLVDEIDLAADTGQTCFVAVQTGNTWPFLIVAQRYTPAGFGWHPGIVVVPETERLFIGAGTRLLAYDLRAPRRLWEERARDAFWNWGHYQDIILMAAEYQLVAWDTAGEKRWSVDVESPWGYRVDGLTVELKIAGRTSAFDLRSGPR